MLQASNNYLLPGKGVEEELRSLSFTRRAKALGEAPGLVLIWPHNLHGFFFFYFQDVPVATKVERG